MKRVKPFCNQDSVGELIDVIGQEVLEPNPLMRRQAQSEINA
jgi:hypothetical protein